MYRMNHISILFGVSSIFAVAAAPANAAITFNTFVSSSDLSSVLSNNSTTHNLVLGFIRQVLTA